MENTGEIVQKSSTKDGNSITMKKRTDVRNTSNCVIADELHVVKNEFVFQGKNKGETTLSKNIKRMTKLILKQQQGNISMTTNAYAAAEQILEDLNYVIISGKPGDGKTCIGRKLLALKAEHGFAPYCISSVSSLQKILNVKERQIFFMDDVFGTVTSDKNKVNEWFHHFENLRCSIDGNKGQTLLVFASRNYILRDTLHLRDKGSFFKAFSVVDLSHDHCLSFDEKEKMAKMYNEEFNLNLSEDEIDSICSLDTSYGFPYALNLFSKSSKLRELGLDFFKNPRERLLLEISGFAQEDKIKYCTFVMIAIMEKVSISKLDDSCEKSNEQKLILRVSGLCDNTPFRDIIKTFIKLKDIYFQTDDDDVFSFSHETYKEATMASIAETHLKLVLEKFDLDFILSSTATTNSGEEDAYFIHIIPGCYFKVLAKRLIDEYINREYNLYIIMKHRCWNDLCFILEFEQFLSGHPLFKSILGFMQSKGTFDKTTFFWSIWYKKEKLIFYTRDKYLSKNMRNYESCIKQDTSDGLIAASYKGLSRECLELLIEFGGDVNAESTFQTFGEDDGGHYHEQFSWFKFIFDDRFGHEVLVRKMTPLMASIYGKQPRILQFLLKKGAKMRILEDNGMSMVHVAAIQNDPHVLKILLKYPLNEFRSCDKKGYTPFHYAKSLDIIKILYEYYPHLLRLQCRKGNTPLHVWARDFFHSALSKEMCKWTCLKAPKCINCRNENGLTAIHSLVKSYQEDNLVAEMVEILITYGANVNATTNRGRTPLHSAARSSSVRFQTAQILLKYGIKINTRDIEGRTALYYALFMDNKVLDVLVKAKADPNIIDEYGLPILHSLIIDTDDGLLGKVFSIQFSHEYRFNFTLIEQLIKIGLDINLKSKKNGNTILHHHLSSSMFPTYSKIETLLKLGADPNEKNNEGSSPTMFAACVGIPLLQLLIQFEGDISLSNCKGETIAHKVLLKCTEDHALSVITYMHKKRVSVHDPDNSGKTPLNIAFERRFESVIKFLLKEKDILYLHQNLLVNAFSYKQCDPEFILKMIKELGITEKLWKSKTKDGKTILMVISENCPSKTLFSLALSKGLCLEDFDKENRNVCNFLVSANLEEFEHIERIKSILEICKPKMLSFLNDEKAIPTTLKCNKFNLLKYMISIATPVTRRSIKNLIPEMINSNMQGKLLIEILELLSCQMNAKIFTDAFIEAVKKPREEFVLSFLMNKGAPVDLFSEGECSSNIFGLLGSECPDSKIDDVFKFLIKNRSLLTITNMEGLNFLQAAIAYDSKTMPKRNRISLISYLIKERIYVNHPSKSGDTALHYCILSNRPFEEKNKILQLLLQNHANVDAKNLRGETALTIVFNAAGKMMCSMESVETLIKHSKYSKKYIIIKHLKIYISYHVNFLDQSDIQKGKLFFLYTLQNLFRSSDLIQPLKISLLKTIPQLTDICVDLGANVNERDSEGNTPLHYIFSSNVIQEERNRLWNYIKHSSSEDDYEFAFMNACYHLRGVKQLEFLLTSGANPNIVNEDGDSPLHLCAKSNFLAIFTHIAMKILLKYGSNINLKNKENLSPLLVAIQNFGNRDRCVRMIPLLESKDIQLFYNMHTIDTYQHAAGVGIGENVKYRQNVKTPYGSNFMSEMFDFRRRWYDYDGHESD